MRTIQSRILGTSSRQPRQCRKPADTRRPRRFASVARPSASYWLPSPLPRARNYLGIFSTCTSSTGMSALLFTAPIAPRASDLALAIAPRTILRIDLQRGYQDALSIALSAFDGPCAIASLTFSHQGLPSTRSEFQLPWFGELGARRILPLALTGTYSKINVAARARI